MSEGALLAESAPQPGEETCWRLCEISFCPVACTCGPARSNTNVGAGQSNANLAADFAAGLLAPGLPLDAVRAALKAS
jgi:hypothetical protein